MADIAIDSSVSTILERAKEGGTAFMLVDVSSSNIYQFYKDSGGALVYSKSTDGGATWGAAVEVASNATYGPFMPSIWYDKWTSGDTGTKIHIAFGDTVNSRIYYINLDTASDTLSTPVIAEDIAGLGSDDSNATKIVKDRGGYLYIAWAVWTGAAFAGSFLRSIDSGANWTARATVWEGDDNDAPSLQLFPANLADSHDIWAVYGDQSASEISLKTYDDSANSWSETSVTTAVSNLGFGDVRQTAGAIRHSDGHLILAICSFVDNVAGDLLIFDINGAGSITQKTNIITDKDDWATVAVYINQNTDDIYVGWIGNPDGSETWTATVTIWRSVSTDDGVTWATPVQYSQDTADDFRSIWSSHSSPGENAGRFMLSWYDDDDDDLFTNFANSVEITGATTKRRYSLASLGVG